MDNNKENLKPVSWSERNRKRFFYSGIVAGAIGLILALASIGVVEMKKSAGTLTADFEKKMVTAGYSGIGTIFLGGGLFVAFSPPSKKKEN
jgi:hypothetical protein